MAYDIPTKSGKVDERAWCLDCDWQAKNWKNALATAARHAKATGHTVECEQGISIVYNPKT
jgi:hypothetical protein